MDNKNELISHYQELIDKHNDLIVFYNKCIDQLEKQNRKLSDGKTITSRSKTFVYLNIIEAEAGTTGFCGGDTGHGGRTYFRLTDLSSTDMSVRIKPRRGETIKTDIESMEFLLGGDSELITITDALSFIADELRKGQSDETLL